MNIRDVKIGTKLDLEVTDLQHSDKSYFYVSQLLDIIDNENIVIAAPISEARLAFIPNNSKLVVIFNHAKYGLIAFDGVLISKSTQDSIAVYNIKISKDFYKIQRRNHYRLEVLLDAYYYIIQDNSSPGLQDSEEINYTQVFTRNISGSGACIVTNDELDVGTHLLLKIELPTGTEIMAHSAVIRSIRDDNINGKKYITGVKFTAMNKKYEEKLIKFIFMKQKEILKQKRLSLL